MRVAITGMGIVSPVGKDVDTFCANLLAGETGIRLAPWAGEHGTSGVLFGRVSDDFDAAEWMDDRVVRGTDGFSRFALAASAQALDDAGLRDLETGACDLDQFRTGVVHGTSMGGLMSLAKAQWAQETRGVDAVDPKMQIKIWPNMAAAQICMRDELHGPSITVTTACASSLDALGTAAGQLASGLADVVICGGTDGGYSCDSPEEEGFVPATSAAEASYGMSSGATDPKKAMLPFAADRAGIVSGEGSAFFVLETEEHATARGARVHAWLTGYGSLADAHHPSSPEPQGTWEIRVMQQAQASAQIAPGDVDALIAHATGTPKGDEAEIRGINSVFADDTALGDDIDLMVTGLKGHTGHTGASSGAMSIIAGIHAMHNGRLVNVAGTETVDAEARFDVIVGEPRDIDLHTLQVNSFGFGGQNASVIIERD